MKTFVTVKYRIPGIHRWEGADNYLRHPHRHEFHFTVWLEVFHNDREVEFINLKEELKKFTQSHIDNLDGKFSCEMLAVDIIQYLGDHYPARDRNAWVEEDGENGAFLTTTDLSA